MNATPLLVGDPAPWFTQRCTTPFGKYSFDMAAGRYIVLFFFDSSTSVGVPEALSRVGAQSQAFDGTNCLFFGVTADTEDESQSKLREELPGIRFFWDSDRAASSLYGITPETGAWWYIIDPTLHIVESMPDAPQLVDKVIAATTKAAKERLAQPTPLIPALIVQNVFESIFCEKLIAYYLQQDAHRSGVFTEAVKGESVAVTDLDFKRRHDCNIRDHYLREQVQARIIRRVVPEIRKAFQFNATSLDRLILASYDSAERGCFGPHRDNTVKAAKHRRFAVSINLNNDFDGGNLIFPEFGQTELRPPTGGAIIFSCSLLHAVTPVTRGRRFACLPFVYDDAAALIKKANMAAIV